MVDALEGVPEGGAGGACSRDSSSVLPAKSSGDNLSAGLQGEIEAVASDRRGESLPSVALHRQQASRKTHDDFIAVQGASCLSTT